MQTHNLVHRWAAHQAIQKATQALNAKIQVTQVMSLQLQQLIAKHTCQGPQGKPPFRGVSNYCKKPGHWGKTII